MTAPTEAELAAKVQELAAELGVVGVAAGVLHGGDEHYGFAGVTSSENPLEVDAKTFFQFGSTGKTFTATALMILADQGKVDLSAPVRTYVPELRLKDEDVASRVTVLDLLNHTAGWDGDLLDDTGDGDDYLEKFIALMAEIEQVTPLGSTISYNNAALNLAGLVVARAHGTTYEKAMQDIVLGQLGLEQTFYTPSQVVTRRFAVGHRRDEESGQVTILRPLFMPRSSAPAGSTATATAHDQLAWARFHLGDGTAPDGTRLLSEESLKRMQQPSVQLPAGALGDAIGISWMLQVVGGVITVRHGGTTNGQHSSFVMVPEHGFAVISMTNTEPSGPQLNDALTTWALERYLGIVEEEPDLAHLSAEDLGPYVGTYDTIAVTVHLDADADRGRLTARIELKPETAAMLREAGQDPDEQEEQIPISLLEGQPDQYVVTDGSAKGLKGYFTRADDGSVDGIHLGGRLATRLKDPQPA